MSVIEFRAELKQVALKVQEILHKLGLIADYPVEIGTDGIWTYEKWASGKAECWGKKIQAVTSWSAWGSIYEAMPYVTAIAYPTDLFIDIPNISITANADLGDNAIGFVEYCNPHTNTYTPVVYATRPANGTANKNITYSYRAVGRWK